jgi:hypothetical protein
MPSSLYDESPRSRIHLVRMVLGQLAGMPSALLTVRTKRKARSVAAEPLQDHSGEIFEEPRSFGAQHRGRALH